MSCLRIYEVKSHNYNEYIMGKDQYVRYEREEIGVPDPVWPSVSYIGKISR